MMLRQLRLRSFVRLYSDASAPKVVSSVPAGTRLKGCNVRKAGEDPVALPDNEYPAWLWEVLDPEAQQRRLDADPIAKARKLRREANKKHIKESNFLKKMGN